MTRRLLVMLAVFAVAFAVAPVTNAEGGADPVSSTCVAFTDVPAPAVTDHEIEASGRLLTITLTSSAMVGETRYGEGVQRVNVLLPAGYDPSGATRYPVLYLLHGFTGNYAAYVDGYGMESIVGDHQVIVVMPDGGYNGGYTDWYGRVPGLGGLLEAPPAWETYHIDELIPFIDQQFPTIGTRQGRAIAGISAGGHGAMKYAARHPDLFVAAGSMSGALNITQDWAIYPTVDYAVLNNLTWVPGSGPASNCKFGDPYTEQVYWENNNSFYLASNLRGVAIWLSSGDGGDGTEDYIRRMNIWFMGALDGAGIKYTNTFRPGTHSPPFWQPDLEQLVPWVMEQFGERYEEPDRFSYRGMSTQLEAWGWSFTNIGREVKEFTYIDRVSVDGFTISGSGMVNVVTAPLYEPGVTYLIAGTGTLDDERTADPAGQLAFPVDLGEPHQTQQYRFECSCWNDLDDENGPGPPLVSPLGDDPELREDWVTRNVTIEPTRGVTD